MGVSAAEIRAGAAYVELVLRDKLASQLAAASDKIKKFAGSVHALGMKAFGGALPGPVGEVMRMAMSPAGAFVGFQTAAKIFANAGHDLHTAAARTGMTVDQLSRLKYVAESSGSSLEALQAGVIKMQRALVMAAQGGAQQTEALALLGVTVQDFAGLDPAQQLTLFAERISLIKDPAVRAATGMAIFGRGAAELFPVLVQGRAGIEGLIAEAEKFGMVTGGQQARAAEELHQKFLLVERSLNAIVRAIGEAVAAMQGEMLDNVLGILVGVRDWIKANKDAVAGIAKMVSMIVFGGAALVAFGGLLSMVATIFTALAGAATFAATMIAVVLSPIGLVVTAMGALGSMAMQAAGGFAAAWQWLVKRVLGWVGLIRESLDAIWNAMAGGRIDLAIKVATSGLSMLGRGLVFQIMYAWSSVKGWFVEAFWSLWDAFQQAANSTLGWLHHKWIDIKEGMIGAMLTVAETLYTAFVKVFAALGEMMDNMVTGIMASMPKMMGGISADEADARREAAAARRAEAAKGAGDMFGGVRSARAKAASEEKREINETVRNRRFDIIEAAAQRRAAAAVQKKDDLKGWNDWALEAVQNWGQALRDAMGVKRKAGAGMPINPLAEFDPDAASLKFGTGGTFSARAASEMGRGGGPVNELVKHARKTAEHAAKMSSTAEAIANTLGAAVGKSIAAASNVAADGIVKLKDMFAFQ